MYQYFLLLSLIILGYSVLLIKSESIVIFLFSSRKKSCIEEKAIQCCSWLLLVGKWRYHMDVSYVFVCLFVFFFQNYISTMGSIFKEREFK